MVILVVFNSFKVVKNLKKPDLVERQKPPFYTTHCPHFTCARQTLFNETNNFDSNILERNESFITNVLLIGNKSLKPDINKSIIMCTIEHILPTQKFFFLENFYFVFKATFYNFRKNTALQ